MEKKENDDLPYIAVSTNYNVENAKRHQQGNFITGYVERKKLELGNEKFEQQQPEIEAEATEAWDLTEQGKETFHKLLEKSTKEIMPWQPLEQALRKWLENRMYAIGETQEMVEKTIPSYRRNFDRNQNHVKTRLKLRNKLPPDQDFRQRVLDPKTRREAIKKYVQNHRDWRHYTVEALNILFEQLEKRR